MSRARRLGYLIILVIILVPAIAVAMSTIDLPRTGQIWSYDPGDDGGIQAGVVFPDPRFVANSAIPDNGNTITDKLTGLIWAKDAGTPTFGPCTGGARTWQQALDYVACLNANNHLGYNDWHLPNINELESLIDLSQTMGHYDWHLPNLIEHEKNIDPSQMGLPDSFSLRRLIDLSQNHPPLTAGHPFANVQADIYWSSTGDAVNALNAWNISMGNGDVSDFSKNKNFYVWPVRTGQCGPGNSVVCLARTGQTASSAAGDDGGLKAGVAWPEPRFADNGDQTAIDNLNGLIWTKDAGTPTFGQCKGGIKAWQQALDYMKCLNDNKYLGHNDWRLPNRKELSSLIDRSKSNPPIPSSHPFINIQLDRYWSSSTDKGETRGAWYADMQRGEMLYEFKRAGRRAGLHVWPVRGGQVGNSIVYSFSISPESEIFTNAGGTDSVHVGASSNKPAWTASSNAPWLTITSGGNGTGSGVVNYTASPNNGQGPRTGTLTIAGETFTVTQLSAAVTGRSIQLPMSGQTTAYAKGDDGDLKKGAAWPDPRFMVNSTAPENDTITDNLTGLIWAKDAGTPTFGPCIGGAKTWLQALNYVACLNVNNYLGHNDWYLPNINELESLVDLSQSKPAMPAGSSFDNLQPGSYWSSSTYASNKTFAWYVYMSDGHVNHVGKGFNSYVLPVRSGQCGPDSVICLPKTGQTTSYATGDDGDLKTGVAWPAMRFIYNGDGTVSDNLTGLIWTKDANAPGPPACAPGGPKTWQKAIEFVSCLNANAYLGFMDWRLPNRKELDSLLDRSNYNPPILSGHPFVNVQMDDYWTSSTSAFNTSSGWFVCVGNCSVYYNSKDILFYIWPVRGGQ